MKTSFFLLGASFCAGAAALAACASEGDEATSAPDGPSNIVTSDAGQTDGDAGDAGDDIGPCVTDCEWFPDPCTDDALCVNGPFNQADPDAGLNPLTQINVIAGRSPSDVWVAGALGAIAHFDGTAWSPSISGSTETFHALWLRDSGEVALAEPTRIYTRDIEIDGGKTPSVDGWTQREAPTAAADFDSSKMKMMYGWGAPQAQWMWSAVQANSAGAINGVWRVRVRPGATPEIGGAVAPYVCSVLPCSQMLGVHGASPDSVWAVGMGGAIAHFTGADGDSPVMTVHNSRSFDALSAVWAASDTDVWAVGVLGQIRHYRGDSILWEVVSDVPTKSNLNAIWGSSRTDVWAVGDGAVVLHYDGTSWARVKIAGFGKRRPNLTAVWSAGPGHVWVGGQGVVLSLGGKS